MSTRSCSPSLHNSMQQAVKQSSQQLGVMSAAGDTQRWLFYITDGASGLKFLIDMGAEVSVVPRSQTHRKTQKGPKQQIINNTSIPTYVTCSLTLNLALCRTFRSFFIIADVSKAILSADCLKHYGLQVDMKLHRLLDSLTHLKLQGITSLVMLSLVLFCFLSNPNWTVRKT